MAATTNRSVARGARGVTLIELLVSVLILVIMILAFSRILSQGQVVVSRSQRIMRANAQAAAIAQVLRRDVAAITMDGFLYVGTEDSPALVFSAVRPFTSHRPPNNLTDIHANAAIICYGAVEDSSPGMTEKVLCRKAHLLTKPVGGAANWDPRTNDVMVAFLTNIQQNQWGYQPDQIISKVGRDDEIASLPSTLDEARDTWAVLVSGCKDINVMYGTVDNNGQLVWFGDGQWSHRMNREDWPALIKMSFTISDTIYEIVCTVGR